MSNPFERKFTQFASNLTQLGVNHEAEHLTKTAGDIYRDKPFTEEFRAIFTVAKVGQTISQVVTFCATAALGVFALSHIIPGSMGIYLAIPVAILFAFGVEKVKRSTLTTAAKFHLKYGKVGAVGAVAIVVMLVSIAAALYGAKELPAVIYPEPKKEVSGASVAQLTTEIDRVQKDIERTAERLNQTPGWSGRSATLTRLQTERARLISERTAAENRAQEVGNDEHIEAVQARAEKVDKLQVYSVSVAVISELIFAICTAFILYYLFRQFAESQPEEKQQEQTIIVEQPVEMPAKPAINGRTFVANLAVNDNRNENRLTKIVMGNRKCAHCEQNYDYRHAKQKYCSDECRIEAWQLRTGSAVKKGRVTGSAADA